MKKGFLSNGPRPPGDLPQDRSEPVASAPATSPQQPATPLNLTPEQWQANFQQCLELLKGPTDERRFVGLLLATKLLPSGGDEAIRAVLKALSWPFISRLLAPLSATAQAASSDELREQHIMGAGLGLAILSSACRLPEVAAGEQLATRLPLLLRVLTAGGVTPLINRGAGSAVAGAASGTSNGTGTGTGSTANAGADEHAVAEALECVVAACSASPSGARGAVLAAGGLGAAAAVLSRTCLSAHKRKAAAASGALSAGSGGLGSWHVPMLAVRLLNLLLTCSTGQRAELVHDHAREVQVLVPALGHLLGSEQLLQELHHSPSPTTPTSAPAPSPATTTCAAPASGTGAGSTGSTCEDAAALQLECLHALLLLLPSLPQDMPQLAAHLKASAAPAGRATPPPGSVPARPAVPAWQAGWACRVQRGLCLLLRSRIGAVQKHSVLQLASALVDLVGPGWLAAQPALPSSHAQAASGTRPAAGKDEPSQAGGEFLRVLANTLHVELGLLLADALHPDVAVESGLGQQPTKGQWQAPEPSRQLLQELACKAQEEEEEEEEEQGEGSAMAVDDGAGAGTGDAATAACKAGVVSTGTAQTSGDVHMADATGAPGSGMEGTQGSTAAVGPGSTVAGGAGPRVTAGERASARLPAVLSLLEAIIEVLARDAALDDADTSDQEWGMQDGRDAWMGAGGVGGVERLSAATQQQVMSALGRAIDEIGQFLETAADVCGFWEVTLSHSAGSTPSPASTGAASPASTPCAATAAANTGTAAAGSAAPAAASQQHPPRGPRDSHGPHTDAAAVAASMAELSLKARPPPQEIIMGCVRMVARFLADAPDTHTAGLRKLLPFMLTFDRVKPLTGGQTGPPSLTTYNPQGLGALAVRLLTPGLLQALATRSPGAHDIRERLCSCALALDTLASSLSASAGAAAACAPSAPAMAAAAKAGKPPAASVMVQAQELTESEQQMADVAMLLLSLVDPEFAQPAAAALFGVPEGSNSKASGPKGGASSTSAKAGASGSKAGSMPQAGAVGGLGAVTRQLLPAVTALTRWAAVRLPHISLGGPSAAAASSAQDGQGPTGIAHTMAVARLMPRTLLCTACFTACVLDASLQQLHQSAQDAPGTQAAAVPPLARLQAEAGISQDQVQAACQLVAAGARAGLALNACVVACQLADEGEAWAAAAARSLRSTAASGVPSASGVIGMPAEGPTTLMDIVSDALGDGEVCWERLLGAAGSVLALLPKLQTELGSRQQPTSSWLVYLDHLHSVAAQQQGQPPAKGDLAAVWERLQAEVVGSSLNAQLLLSTWKAVGAAA